MFIQSGSKYWDAKWVVIGVFCCYFESKLSGNEKENIFPRENMFTSTTVIILISVHRGPILPLLLHTLTRK